MRKLITLVVAVLIHLFFGNAIAQEWMPTHKEEYDVRHARWGMSQKDVIASERGLSPANTTNNTVLYFYSTDGGVTYSLSYIFANNNLVGVARLLSGGNPDDNIQYKEYVNEKSMLTEIFGNPNIHQEQIGSSFIGNKDLYSYCVKLGKCRFWLQWVKDRSGIILSLEEKDGNPIFGVIYWDRAHEQNILHDLAMQNKNKLLTKDDINDHATWIFPDSSSRYLSSEEIIPLSGEQKWIAKNEIYARNGYIFDSPKGKAYARSLGGAYRPQSQNIKFNKYEQHNIMLLHKFQ